MNQRRFSVTQSTHRQAPGVPSRMQQEATSRTQAAPKRYAHAYIRHFIIFAVFAPFYFSYYNHGYYQDLFPAGILALLIVINLFHKWRFDFKTNRIFAYTLGGTLLLYNVTCFVARHKYAGLQNYWKTDQLNITVAFLFLLTLLLVREQTNIVSRKVLQLFKYSIIINNIFALITYFCGYRRFFMYNLLFIKNEMDPDFKAFQWYYQCTNEYALILLLYMAFFIIYRKLFRNIWTYALSQGLLLLLLVLSNAPGALLAAGLLWTFVGLHYVTERFPIIKENLLYILPLLVAALGFVFFLAFTKNEIFNERFLMWKGSLEIIRDTPQGWGNTFGVAPYETNYLPAGMFHAHNTFLVHMQRHSTPVGIMFLLLFVVLITFSAIRKPNFQTAGIWLAALLMLCMDFTLQTTNLPLVLFLIYCIFFRPKAKKPVVSN